ncbi:hydroxyacylglutathione hydrolase [Hydromonas duriensis]|uniref:Hydroxyacylglutathione hydrolase n=1 Tax=Hydromonas duriensis TaxID=1527608 RepID=A0A4R6Y630_9BURK|nr:hydroxyacylglutathione hydrolase [Hydromonas duriensis]TDR30192.1 hydroxyacylglutathione hydrolase [Hydromonas duriensis]
MPYILFPIPCRDDNYTWIIHNQKHAWVIDPSLSEPVDAYLTQHQLILADILVTHHHYDHIEGIRGLLPLLQGRVVGGSQRIRELTEVWGAPASFELSCSNMRVQMLATPGHTYDHVAYFLDNGVEQPVLFCGDTIFSAGCGRVFDGTIEELFCSFTRLIQLPEDTRIACAHEYTLANLDYALAIDSSHDATVSYHNEVKYARQRNMPSLPTHLGLEKRINPYMRCIAFESNWVAALTEFAMRRGEKNVRIDSPLDAFTLCRKLKNNF